MKEQELRDKIVGIVLDVPITGIKIREILGGEATANNIAEALIAAGMGDVSEYKKHRVIVDISPALKGEEYISVPNTPSKIIQLYNAEEVEQIVKERDKYKHRAEVAERALMTVCTNVVKDEEDNLAVEPRARVLYRAYLKQAEKELAEEGKDD